MIPKVVLQYESYTVKKNSVKFTVKNRQLWLPEFYRKKYGNNVLGFTVLISLTDIMLIPTYWSTEICFASLKYTDNHQKQVMMRKSYDEPKPITSSF